MGNSLEAGPVKMPLSFHHVCSDNVRIGANGKEAVRLEGFCKGICFSSRPVAVGECIYMLVKVTSSSWAGTLRVGFTSNDPGSMKGANLPRYACPDLVSRPGYWAKALPESYCVQGSVIMFKVNHQGAIYVHLNSNQKEEYLMGGVAVTGRLWALIDVYGNATEIEFVDGFHAQKPAVVPVPVPGPTKKPILISENEPPKYFKNVVQGSFPFHALTGKHVSLNIAKSVATRSSQEYANGYVFSSRALGINESVVLKILGFDSEFSGGLTVGVTSCNPGTIHGGSLPDDSDDLIDSRKEYWVVHKNVYRFSECGDELSFTLTDPGTNRPAPAARSPKVELPPRQHVAPPRPPRQPLNRQPMDSQPVDRESSWEKTDCVVCMENARDTAVNDCGHISMCYECAKQIKAATQECPICKSPIKSLLKVYQP